MKLSAPPLVCLYFQVHQPYRLADLRITDIGRGKPKYFDDAQNRRLFRKVAERCYLPANRLLLSLLRRYPDFSIAYSLSGVFLDQCETYGKDVLASFRRLAATGKVEFLAETYYHSLSALTTPQEFCEQVQKHSGTIERIFGKRPRIFRNTELIYRNDLAEMVRLMGFKGILTEGADRILGKRSPNRPFTAKCVRLKPEIGRDIERLYCPSADPPRTLSVLLKNYRLSDDVAFRFSDRTWLGFPLTAEKFTDWITGSGGHSVNLFMDYETFGEHQWKESGIFDFLRELPGVWKRRGVSAVTPSRVLDAWDGRGQKFDAPDVVSWADHERDLSAWQGNEIQKGALESLYALERDVKSSGDAALLTAWRLLQTSDHFYYMSTKCWADGSVHRYFSPYSSPFEAYRRFTAALYDLRVRVGVGVGKKSKTQS